MGFFNKLKKKLFTLDIDQEPKKKTSKAKVEKEVKPVDKKLVKKQKKLDKYVSGLEKANLSFVQKIKLLKSKHVEIDEEFFEELEEILIMSDISVPLVVEIIGKVKYQAKTKKITDQDVLMEVVAEEIYNAYGKKNDTSLNIKEGRINVFIMVGVNGAGKTTSIAKLAHRFKGEGKKVMIAAGDTFRAGAVQQLNVWADRIGVDIVKPTKEGADPASVVFDAVAKAKEKNVDILIIDTAGRLQNKVNLMNELAKMHKIISREIPDAPHETLLVLDATTGQNGVSQAKSFKEVTGVTGIVLTKMDGTSKGGIVLTIKHDLNIGVKLMGLGESLDDLQEFDLDSFIYGMTKGLVDESK